MAGNGWEWMGMAGNGCEWQGMDGNGWEWMEMAANGCEWMGMDGNGCECPNSFFPLGGGTRQFFRKFFEIFSKVIH
jgi:hypothetical protein